MNYLLKMQRGQLPSETALGVTELLENILQFLPISDLLRAQQVNKYFRDTIAQSTSLQEALFLRPKNVWQMQTPLPELNPLFAQHAAVGHRSIGFSHNGTSYYISAPQRILVPNPVHLINEQGYGTWHLDISIQDLDPVLVKDTIPLPASDSGTWQNMYISNPPCSIHVKVWRTTDKGYAGTSGRGPLSRSGDYKGKIVVLAPVSGATFGNVLEQAAHVRDHNFGPHRH
jgi:hypothetical protein